MSRLKWGETSKRLYEAGVQNAVVYPQDATGAYPTGVAWSGMSAVTESPSGAEPNPVYADNGKYLTLMSVEEFAATIEAYTYPDEFAVCDGSAELAEGVYAGQQTRKPFGLVYKTLIGNDTVGQAHGYKLHLIYGGLAAPSEKAYSTINDTPEAITFSWEVSTTPVDVPGLKPAASLTIDSTKVDAGKLKELEDILFGVDADAGAVPPVEAKVARLPLPAEILTLMSAG